MSTLIVVSIMALVFSGTYMILSMRFWRVIIGTAFLSHAVNLVLLSSGGYLPGAHPPILDHASTYVDPLPQALILTAIVISFGVTAFILIVLRQVSKSTGTTDLGQLEAWEWRHSKTEEPDHD